MVSSYRSSSRAERTAFTLLELMLSLVLTSLILVAVGMALDLHLRSYQRRRSHIEEAQLARTIMRIIADDIRAAVQHEEPDLSSYEKMLAGISLDEAAAFAEELGDEGSGGASLSGDTASFDSGSFDTGSDDMEGGDLNGEGEPAPGEEGTSNTEDLADSTTIPTMPGIYGNQYELQIDVSRLPRVEEYQPLLLDDPTAVVMDVPSDVKTVTYYVQSAGVGMPGSAGLGSDSSMSGSMMLQEDPDEMSGGLVRRELDRSVTQWAVENGNVTGLMQAGDLVASEVVAVEFRYFDGIQWLTEWDMSTQESLPMAVEIMLAMQPFDSEWRPAAEISNESIMATPQDGVRYHRMVVHVPTGEPSDGSTSDVTDTGASSGSEAGGAEGVTGF